MTTRGDTERLRKTKVILPTGAGHRRRVAQGTWERHQGGREAEDRSGVNSETEAFIGVSEGKAAKGRVNSLGRAS